MTQKVENLALHSLFPRGGFGHLLRGNPSFGWALPLLFLAQDFDLVVSNAFISHPSRLGGPWSPDTSSSRTSITDLNFDEKVDTYLPHRKGFLQSGPMPSISAGFLSLCLIWGLSWVAIKYSREATLKKEATWKS